MYLFYRAEDHGLFKGVFVCEDDDVSKFVDYINNKTKHVSSIIPLTIVIFHRQIK